MRTFRIVAFWAILAALIGSLIIYGKCMAHPVYGERGNIVGETLEDHGGMVDLSPLGHLESDSVIIIPDDITALLRECLDYIDDSSVVYNDPSDRANFLTESTTLAIYELRSAQTDADEAAQTAQERADRIKAQAEQLRKETELHKRIVEMIKKLEGEKK